MGKSVDAEEFEVATIFFSDIADFGDLSRNIEPMQIVEILNTIYSFMDKQINEYDVYKVYWYIMSYSRIRLDEIFFFSLKESQYLFIPRLEVLVALKLNLREQHSICGFIIRQ